MSFQVCRKSTHLSKRFIKNQHWNGFYFVWVLIWAFRVSVRANFLSQKVQWNGFSFVWILRCFVRVPLWVNLLLQNEHWNGFSFVWVLMWFLRSQVREKVLSHSIQTNDLIFSWTISKYLSKSQRLKNTFSQTSHLYLFCLVWIELMWWVSMLFVE